MSYWQLIIFQIMNYLQTLSPAEIWVIIGLAAVLVLFITYRIFGFGAMGALLIAYLLAYAIYANNLYGFYQRNTAENNQNMNNIQKELNK
jgi:hypothetical protein